MKVFVVVANNNQSYEEHDTWNCFYSTEDETSLKSRIKEINEKLQSLAEEASQFYHSKRNGEYLKCWDETAPGKRYVKFLRKNKIISKDQKYFSSTPISLFYHELIEAPKCIAS